MVRRLCLRRGCPETAVHRGYCQLHRLTTSQRGYGAVHQGVRRALSATLPAPCGYGGEMLYPDEAWVAAHRVDGDPSAGWMVSCPRHNEQAKER